MAVHSLKDMPTALPEGLILGAVLERGEINDAFVSLKYKSLNELTTKDKIATSSLRRIAGLLHLKPNLNIVDIRGNVITRLEKMKEGYCDAMIMATTGLRRLGLQSYIAEIIAPEIIIPAVGQGAIGIEINEKDEETKEIISQINHSNTWNSIVAERAFMHTLEGGCQVPVGCYTSLTGDEIKITGFVASLDGKQYIKQELSGNIINAEEIGTKLANQIISLGGKQILNAIRKS